MGYKPAPTGDLGRFGAVSAVKRGRNAPHAFGMRQMSRQDANTAFALTSFLYGGNAAYIEDLYARYEADPASVDSEWQAFFKSLKDDPASVTKNAKGASWKKPGWPPIGNGELVAALD